MVAALKVDAECDVYALLRRVRDDVPGVVDVAAENVNRGFVFSGDTLPVTELVHRLCGIYIYRKDSLRRVRACKRVVDLRVSAPFHCSLMAMKKGYSTHPMP